MSEAVEKRRVSPRYPSVNLSDAIDLIAKVHASDRTHAVAREAAARNMGFAGLSGRSMSVIGSLLQYGLLQKMPESEVRVSDRAVSILHPDSSNERSQALKDALRDPPLFGELIDRFGDHVPSKDSLRSYLIKRGFQDRALPTIIRCYSESQRFASSSFELGVADEFSDVGKSDSLGMGDVTNVGPFQTGLRAERESARRVSTEGEVSRSARPSTVEIQGTLREDVFTVEEGSVTVVWPKQLSQESFDDISDWFEIILRKMKRAVLI